MVLLPIFLARPLAAANRTHLRKFKRYADVVTFNGPDYNGANPHIQALQDFIDQDVQLKSCNGYADGTSVWDAMQQEVENNNAVGLLSAIDTTGWYGIYMRNCPD